MRSCDVPGCWREVCLQAGKKISEGSVGNQGLHDRFHQGECARAPQTSNPIVPLK